MNQPAEEGTTNASDDEQKDQVGWWETEGLALLKSLQSAAVKPLPGWIVQTLPDDRPAPLSWSTFLEQLAAERREADERSCRIRAVADGKTFHLFTRSSVADEWVYASTTTSEVRETIVGLSALLNALDEHPTTH